MAALFSTLVRITQALAQWGGKVAQCSHHAHTHQDLALLGESTRGHWDADQVTTEIRAQLAQAEKKNAVVVISQACQRKD